MEAYHPREVQEHLHQEFRQMLSFRKKYEHTRFSVIPIFLFFRHLIHLESAVFSCSAFQKLEAPDVPVQIKYIILGIYRMSN